MVSLTELGVFLKQAREEKGITLDELQRITKIQKRYLQNVEEGNYDALPGVFYARAFVKQYAEVVGLDPEMVFEEYKNEIPSTPKEAIPEQLSRVKRSRAEVNTSDSKILKFLPRILVTIGLIGIAIIIWTVLQNKNVDQVKIPPASDTSSEVEEAPVNPLLEEDEDEQSNPEENDVVTTPPTEEVDSIHRIELVEVSGRNSTYKLSDTNEFLVEVTTIGETWLELRNGKKKTFFSGLLTFNDSDQSPTSASYDFTNESEAFIKLGYAANSIVKINGEVLEIPTEVKDLQNITILFEKSMD